MRRNFYDSFVSAFWKIEADYFGIKEYFDVFTTVYVIKKCIHNVIRRNKTEYFFCWSGWKSFWKMGTTLLYFWQAKNIRKSISIYLTLEPQLKFNFSNIAKLILQLKIFIEISNKNKPHTVTFYKLFGILIFLRQLEFHGRRPDRFSQILTLPTSYICRF